jgi:hypothetical protein
MSKFIKIPLLLIGLLTLINLCMYFYLDSKYELNLVFTAYNKIDTTEKNHIALYKRGNYEIALLRTKYREPYKFIHFTPIEYTKDIGLNDSHIFFFEEVIQANISYIYSGRDTFSVIDSNGNSHVKHYKFVPELIILSNSENDTFQFQRTYYSEDKFNNIPEPTLLEQLTIGPIKELF